MLPTQQIMKFVTHWDSQNIMKFVLIESFKKMVSNINYYFLYQISFWWT